LRKQEQERGAVLDGRFVVLGSGMAGFGAASYLHDQGVRAEVYDQNPYFGGHTASLRDARGFLFDFGPHISFTKDKRIQDLFAGYVDGDYHAIEVKLDNYWRGLRLTHPVQLHLNGLPRDLIIEIVADFVKEQAVERPIGNYEDWLVASYGRRFAELFPLQYTRKYHLTSADNMTTEWLGPRMYRPTLEELLRGALGPWSPESHYITTFRYPAQGGFASYLRSLPDIASLHLGHRLIGIDTGLRQLRFANGAIVSYDALVSSIALPDLVPMIAGAPRDIVEASRRLACSTCVLVNVGVQRADLSDAHVTYVYDPDISFTRLSFPHMLAPANAPAGCGSVQAEVYFSDKYRPLEQTPDEIVDKVIADLRKTGTLREDDVIVTRHAATVRYANVIFDLDRAKALETVHGYLDDIGVAYCGRYGDWGYMWTDESYISGERAAESVLSATPA
jgi:protoporphyrinogen oxidase